MQLLKAIKLCVNRFRRFKPSYASSKVKNENDASEIGFPTTKNLINKLAMNNKRLLMAAEFYFVHPVGKDS